MIICFQRTNLTNLFMHLKYPKKENSNTDSSLTKKFFNPNLLSMLNHYHGRQFKKGNPTRGGSGMDFARTTKFVLENKQTNPILWSLAFILLLLPIAIKAQDITIDQQVASVTSVPTGQYFTYTINFACNNTTDGTPCQNVIISDFLPTGVELNGPTTTSAYILSNPGTQEVVVSYVQGGTPDFSEPAELVLNLGDINPGSSGILTINARYIGYGVIPNGYTSTNTITIASDNDTDANNNSDDASITATTAKYWETDVVVQPGNLDSGASEPEAPLDHPVFYALGFDGSVTKQDDYYLPNNPNPGGLALYDPFMVSLLEPGLACDDIDDANTSQGYVCLAPGQSDINTGYTNTSGTQYAVVWDLDDDTFSPCGNKGTTNPMPSTNPCPGLYTCTEFNDGDNWRAGLRTKANDCPINLTLIYRSADGFNGGDVPKNDVELWGKTTDGVAIAVPGNSEMQHASSVDVTLLAPVVEGKFDKDVFSFGTQTDHSTFVGDILQWGISLENKGNVVLDNVVISDVLPAETDIHGFGFTPGQYTDTYDLTLYYSNDTSETITGLSGTILSTIPSSRFHNGLNPNSDFNIPSGEHLDRFEVSLNAPLKPGQKIVFRMNTTVMPARDTDDVFTASYNNPLQDPDLDEGTQLNGSMVLEGDYVTNCASFTSDQISEGPACDEIEVGMPAILTSPTKYKYPNNPVEVGDKLTFALKPHILFGTVNVTDLTFQDVLPANLEFVPGSIRFVHSQNGQDSSANPYNWVITDTNTYAYGPDPSRTVVEITISSTSGVLDFTNHNYDLERQAVPGFDVIVGPNHLQGTFRNEFSFSRYTHAGTPVNWVGRHNTAGTQLFADNSPGTAKKGGANYQVTGLPQGAATTYSDGDLTPGESVAPEWQSAELGSTASFRMELANVGNEPLTNINIVNLLPRIGDIGATTLEPRDSAFDPIFAGNITAYINDNGTQTVVNGTVYYSTSDAPCRTDYILGASGDFPTGCTDDFSTTAPATLADTKAIGLKFGNLELPPGTTLNIKFDVEIPNGINPVIAWNNFSWLADGFYSKLQVGAEGSSAGLWAAELENIPERCGDGIDNDGDGLADCDDGDCATVEGCDYTNTTGGNNGGLESNARLVEKVNKRYYERIKNNTYNIKTNSYDRDFDSFAKTQKNKKNTNTQKRTDLELIDLIPINPIPDAVSYNSTPNDLVGVTNATKVLAVDYFKDDVRKGAVLALKSNNGVYEHTKVVCDRVTGSKILNIWEIYLYDDKKLIVSKIESPYGEVEYGCTFSFYHDQNEDIVLENHWNVVDYSFNEEYYNFQVWADNTLNLKNIVEELIQNIEQANGKPLQYIVGKRPDVFVKNIEYINDRLAIHLVNPSGATSVPVKGLVSDSETQGERVFYDTFTLNGDAEQTIMYDTNGAYTMGITLNESHGAVTDNLFFADGVWGLDVDETKEIIPVFETYRDFYEEGGDELYIGRGAKIRGTLNEKFVLYRSIQAKFGIVDISSYNGLAFEARSNMVREMDIRLINPDIAYEDQVRGKVVLNTDKEQYYLDFESLQGDLSQLDKVVMVIFEVPNWESGPVNFALEMTKLRLTTESSAKGFEKGRGQERLNRVYPNPVTETSTLAFESERSDAYELYIRDISGKTVHASQGTLSEGLNRLTISRGGHPAGNYSYELRLNKEDNISGMLIYK